MNSVLRNTSGKWPNGIYLPFAKINAARNGVEHIRKRPSLLDVVEAVTILNSRRFHDIANRSRVVNTDVYENT